LKISQVLGFFVGYPHFIYKERLVCILKSDIILSNDKREVTNQYYEF